MMDQKDWDHQFQRIVENIDMTDMTEPREGISLWDINRAVLGLNEAAMYLSRFVGQFIQHDEMEFPEMLEGTLRQIINLADKIAEELSDCTCPECIGGCEHCEDEEDICEDCVRELLAEDEEDD